VRESIAITDAVIGDPSRPVDFGSLADLTLATDKQLWDEAVAGDSNAFGIVFFRHANKVYDYCLRRLGSQNCQTLLGDGSL
jgi:hypothetical protein